VLFRTLPGTSISFEWQLPNVSPQQASSAVNELNGDEWNHAVNNSTSNVRGAGAMSPPGCHGGPRSGRGCHSRESRACVRSKKHLTFKWGPTTSPTADNTTFLGFRAQMDLPVVNNGEPLERQRLAEHHQRITAWNQAQRRAELEATAAIDRYATALAVVKSDDVGGSVL
jgi:hypothetical protein